MPCRMSRKIAIDVLTLFPIQQIMNKCKGECSPQSKAEVRTLCLSLIRILHQICLLQMHSTLLLLDARFVGGRKRDQAEPLHLEPVGQCDLTAFNGQLDLAPLVAFRILALYPQRLFFSFVKVPFLSSSVTFPIWQSNLSKQSKCEIPTDRDCLAPWISQFQLFAAIV